MSLGAHIQADYQAGHHANLRLFSVEEYIITGELAHEAEFCLSRQCEKFLIGQSRKFRLTAARLERWNEIAMSQEERDWLDWLKRAQEGQVTQKWVAEKMGVSDRWVRRLLVAMKEKGDGVVVHGLCGRRSNRRIDEKIRERAMEIVKSLDWHDFRPTFASEQLAKRHQIQVSKETVRKWMMAEGVWESRGRKLREVHAWRPRRSHYGELVQSAANHWR